MGLERVRGVQPESNSVFVVRLQNAALKLVNLTLAVLSLQEMLRQGFPTSLVYTYASLVLASSASCSLLILSGSRHHAFVEVLVNSGFDMTNAVLFPMLVMGYCRGQFALDRASARLAQQLAASEAPFEPQARLMADVAQLALFRASFNSLRIRSVTDLAVRVGMSLSFCYRTKRMVEVLMERRVWSHLVERSHQVEQRLQKPVPRKFALLFAVLGGAIMAYTHLAIRTSFAKCRADSECVRFAYSWPQSAALGCPCLVLSVQDAAPRTFDQWLEPPDATSRVRRLTARGTLQVLHLVNRRLPVWPQELAACANLLEM